MLDTVDLATTLHLDGHDLPLGGASQQVHRPDRRGILPADQAKPVLEVVRCLRQQALQLEFNAVLLQTRVLAHLVCSLEVDLPECDGERLPLRVGDDPPSVFLDEAVGCVHPVERLVRTTVGVDGDAPLEGSHPPSRKRG